MNKLAIIDWGIGGIGIYKLVKERLGIPVTYLSDTGATPYGKMERGELAGRLDTIREFLEDRGVTHLLIGCNAASTAIPDMQPSRMHIEGMIDNAVEVSLALKPKNLGVIGGRRTILSGAYRKRFAANGIKISQRIAQPLSGLIEAGEMGSDEFRDAARQILEPLRGCSHVLLACTHYPAAEAILSEFVSPRTQFVDPAPILVRKVAAWKIGQVGEDEILTTGDPKAMAKAARLAFGVELPATKSINL
jgi:glutamate racemase